MNVKIKCSKCQSEGWLFLPESTCQTPYRCWKCYEIFIATIEDNEVKSMRPPSAEDLENLDLFEGD